MNSENSSAPRALIIDDEISTQKFLELTLKRYGAVETVCDNAATGLYHYIREAPYDIVILDIVMPGVDGEYFLKIAEFLHRSSILNQPPRIIVYTSVGSAEQLRSYLDMKCVHCVLQKPVAKRRILKEIESILSRMQDRSGC